MSWAEFDSLLLRLAVSGRFDPARVLREVPGDLRDEVSAMLADLCDEDLSGGRYRWVLRASARRAGLERIRSKNSLGEALEGAPAIERGDRFGEALRASLAGKLTPLRKGDSVRDEARQAALQFARHAPVMADRKIDEVLDDTRMRIALREREDALSIVLGRKNKLFGRRAELSRIRRFVDARSRDARPLLITGIGGVGKSTLLAAVIRAWGRGRERPAVVLLDFDRPALSSGEPIEIAREFTRQLSIEWTTSKKLPRQLRFDGPRILREKRANLNATYEADGEVRRVPAEDQFGKVESLLLGPISNEMPKPLRAMPIVLVMDTFEVVGRQGPEVTKRVLDLEAAFRDRAGFSRLRTIVSGRGIPLEQELASARFGESKRWIKLEGLDEEAAAAFLADRDDRKKFRRKAMRLHAARALKGHPLAMLVLERYARPRPAREVERLLRDVEHDPGFSAEFAQTFLYRRILERIGDPEVRALAHPGLVLRYVNPGLIRLVLSVPCGIGPLSEASAARLFEKLKQEYWLVEKVQTDLVRHRADLRRLMLPGLFAAARPNDAEDETKRKRELSAAAIAVSRAASDFYREGPPAGDPVHAYWASLSTRTRLAEQLYYDALSGAPAPSELSREDAADIRSELGEDIESMPEAWRAIIKASHGEAAALSDQEVTTLTGSVRESVEGARIDADLLQGDTARARKRSSAAQARVSSEVAEEGIPGRQRSPRDLVFIEREVVAAFADADFERVRKISRSLIDALASGTFTPATSKSMSAERLWETAVWKSILVRPWGDPNIEASILRHESDYSRAPTSMSLLAMAGARNPRLSGNLDPKARGLDHTRLLAGYLARRVANVRSSYGFRIAVDTLAVAALIEPPAQPPAGAIGRKSGRDVSSTRMRPMGPRIERFIEKPPLGKLTLEELQLLYQTSEIFELIFEPGSEATDLPDVLRRLRGLTPELHQPARRLLLSIGDDAARKLAGELAEASRLWPRELKFTSRGRIYTHRNALPLIETADRLGLFGLLLQVLAERDRRGADLVAIHDSITERFFTPFAVS